MISNRHPVQIIQKRLIAGIFYRYSCTLKAYHSLCEKGYANAEISMVMTLETWQKIFLEMLDGLLDQKASQNEAASPPDQPYDYENPAGMKALIRTSSIMQGAGIMLAGPIGRRNAGLETNRACSGISGTFEMWGLPASVSNQYEEELICGGIMIGTQCRLKLHDESIADQWRACKGAHIHLHHSSNEV